MVLASGKIGIEELVRIQSKLDLVEITKIEKPIYIYIYIYIYYK